MREKSAGEGDHDDDVGIAEVGLTSRQTLGWGLAKPGKRGPWIGRGGTENYARGGQAQKDKGLTRLWDIVWGSLKGKLTTGQRDWGMTEKTVTQWNAWRF